MKALAAGVLATCVSLAGAAANAAPAAPCGEGLGETGRIEGRAYTVAYRTVPDPVRVGAHFALDFAVCPRAGTAAGAPVAVRVDATMPEHRHGMNYRPVVTARAPSVYRAEGLMFHMPGRWQLTFDVDADGRTERLAGVLLLE